MKKLLVLFGLVSVLALTGCGERVMINNSEVGKQLTVSGLEDKVRSPGALRLESCVFSSCPKLVRLSVAEESAEIGGAYYNSQSDLELDMTVAMQYTIKRDNNSLNEVFSRIKPVQASSSRDLYIQSEQVYNVFVQPVLRDTVRASLNNYSIEEIMDNLPQVREYVESEVRKRLSETPIDVVNLTFSKVGWPKVILQAKEEFAKIEIDKATQFRAIAADLEIMEKQMDLEIARAKMTLKVDSVVASAMTPQLQNYMLLNAINKSAENGTSWAITDSLIRR